MNNIHRLYKGKNPVFKPLQLTPTSPVTWVKVEKGVPFTRIEKKTRHNRN